MTSSVTILLLDDEPLLRRATELMLSSRGGHVTAADSADEAVALAGARLYDVAVFDISSSGPSAAEVVRRIRANGLAPRRVIVVSSEPLDPRDADVIDEVIVKPYPFERLVHAIFGAGSRKRTRSGVFPRVPDPSAATRGARLTARAPRGAARALRGRGG